MRVLTLCYHAVSEDWTAPLSVTPRELERQLRLVLRRGYSGATFTDAVAGGARGRLVAVTFDDGFASVLDLALPILSRLGLPATLFVPTGFPGGPTPLAWPGTDRWLRGPHEHELRSLTWDQVRELGRAGWEIGSHTRTHPRLTTLDDDRLADELEGSREDCRRELGVTCRSLAYPYGDADARVLRATRRAGYEAAAALLIRPRGPRHLRRPRVGVFHRDTLGRFALKLSPVGGAARTVKALVRARESGPRER